MKRYRAIAEYYDREHERMEMLRRDVPFFLKQQPKRKMSVLELATGTARAAIPIAQAGHEVTGIDYAEDMLAIAKRKRDAVGLSERDLKLVRADVLKLKVGRKFDRIAIFFNTMLAFTTLADLDRFLQTCRRHLKPSGRLWIDVFNPNLSLLVEEKTVGMESSVFYVPRFDRTVYQTVDVRRDMSRQWMEIIFRYRWFDAKGREKNEKIIFEMTVIYPREFEILLQRNGFKIVDLWGDYDASKLSAKSPRMIASCRLA